MNIAASNVELIASLSLLDYYQTSDYVETDANPLGEHTIIVTITRALPNVVVWSFDPSNSDLGWPEGVL